jgi:hypothetical protein
MTPKEASVAIWGLVGGNWSAEQIEQIQLLIQRSNEHAVREYGKRLQAEGHEIIREMQLDIKVGGTD